MESGDEGAELDDVLAGHVTPRTLSRIREAGVLTVGQARERFAVHKTSVSVGGPLRAGQVRAVRRALGLLEWPDPSAASPPKPDRVKTPDIALDPAEVARHVRAEERTVVLVRWTCLDEGHNHQSEGAARQCVEKRLRTSARTAARAEVKRDMSSAAAERYASLHDDLGTYAAVARAEGVPYDYALQMVKKGHRLRRVASRNPPD